MADDESTKPAVAATEDTSTVTEDTPDTEDTGLEDMEENFENTDVEDTAEADATEESSDSAKPDAAEAKEESTEDSGENTEEQSDAAPQDEETAAADTTDADIKQQAARRAYLEREQKRQERERIRQAEKQKAQSDYVAQAEDEKDLALRQLQVDAYNNKVERNAAKLESGLEKAVANIDLFKTGTEAVKNRLLRAVDTFEMIYVTKDRNGDPVDVKGDVYAYLQQEAESIRELLGDGAMRQEHGKAGQRARTLATPIKSPKKPKVDPDLQGFDEEANRW